MKRSDEILKVAFDQGRGLNTGERMELREAYADELKESERTSSKIAQSTKEFKDQTDMLNMPRHRVYGKCLDFTECPIDFKCRSYNSSYVKCANCILQETDDICMKKEIHTPANLSMFLQRERIDLDEEK